MVDKKDWGMPHSSSPDVRRTPRPEPADRPPVHLRAAVGRRGGENAYIRPWITTGQDIVQRQGFHRTFS
jgi:hypothetical protein